MSQLTDRQEMLRRAIADTLPGVKQAPRAPVEQYALIENKHFQSVLHERWLDGVFVGVLLGVLAVWLAEEMLT